MSKLSMNAIDEFIDTSINRFCSEAAPVVSEFYFDLRSGLQRISERAVTDAIELCNVRGLDAERINDGLIIKVNLNICRFNPSQTAAYNASLNYIRAAHGYMS